MASDKLESKSQLQTPSSLECPVEDVVIKDSTLMLLGWAMVGKQHFGGFCPLYDDPNNPSSVCAVGARNLARHGSVRSNSDDYEFLFKSRQALGVDVSVLNDAHRLTIPQIAAMLAEKGL